MSEKKMKSAATGFKKLKAVKEIQKIIAQVRAAQVQLQKMVRDKNAIIQAKQYTERFRKELKKYMLADIARVRVFVDRARKELRALQKQYLGRPGHRLKNKASKSKKVS